MIGPIYLNFFTDILEIFKPCVTIFCWRPLVVVDVMKKYFCVYLGVSNDIGKEKKRGKKKCNWIKKISAKSAQFKTSFFSEKQAKGTLRHWKITGLCIKSSMYIFPTIFSYGLEYFLYELYESKTCLFGAFRLLRRTL